MDEIDETTIGDVVIKLSSRGIPCFDGSKNQVRWFQDKTGQVWLNAGDMMMGMTGKPNTCGNCIQWHNCKVKDRDRCPGDCMPSHGVETSQEEMMGALHQAGHRSMERLHEAGLEIVDGKVVSSFGDRIPCADEQIQNRLRTAQEIHDDLEAFFEGDCREENPS